MPAENKTLGFLEKEEGSFSFYDRVIHDLYTDVMMLLMAQEQPVCWTLGAGSTGLGYLRQHNRGRSGASVCPYLAAQKLKFMAHRISETRHRHCLDGWRSLSRALGCSVSWR